MCYRDFPHSPSLSESGEVLYPPPLFPLSCPEAQEAATAHQQPLSPAPLYEVTDITQLHMPREPVRIRVAQNSPHRNTEVLVCILCALAGLAQHLVSITAQVGER